jgi:hypothetical protein
MTKAYFDLMASMRLFTQDTLAAYSAPWLLEQRDMPDLAASYEVLSSIQVTHERPRFRLLDDIRGLAF